MSDDFADLPREIREGLLAFMSKVDGEFEVSDKMGMVQFILEHSDDYPALLKTLRVDHEALTRHIEQTGEVPAGVKAVRTITTPGSNVVRVDVLHGPAKFRKDNEK